MHRELIEHVTIVMPTKFQNCHDGKQSYGVRVNDPFLGNEICISGWKNSPPRNPIDLLQKLVNLAWEKNKLGLPYDLYTVLEDIGVYEGFVYVGNTCLMWEQIQHLYPVIWQRTIDVKKSTTERKEMQGEGGEINLTKTQKNVIDALGKDVKIEATGKGIGGFHFASNGERYACRPVNLLIEANVVRRAGKYLALTKKGKKLRK